MNEDLPPCPQCSSNYAYEDRRHLVCPECGYEWDPQVLEESTTIVVKDANGNLLQPGDHVTLIKDLKVKGSSSVVKIGTKVKILNLADGDHNIDCKVEGIGPMMLKSEFVKKSN